MKYIITENGVVTSWGEATPSNYNGGLPDGFELLADDYEFPAETNAWEWFIDIGPFMDRFGANKIPILASADATVRAVTQDMIARKWIDLQRDDVGTAIDLLISKGFTLDKTAILTTPVEAEENLALRKLYF